MPSLCMALRSQERNEQKREWQSTRETRFWSLHRPSNITSRSGSILENSHIGDWETCRIHTSEATSLCKRKAKTISKVEVSGKSTCVEGFKDAPIQADPGGVKKVMKKSQVEKSNKKQNYLYPETPGKIKNASLAPPNIFQDLTWNAKENTRNGIISAK